jgi:hypothetical protein
MDLVARVNYILLITSDVVRGSDENTGRPIMEVCFTRELFLRGRMTLPDF